MSLKEFVRESNRIEGIHREPTDAEIEAHDKLLRQTTVEVADMEAFVSVVQPNAKLRRSPTMNVRVGNHIAPQGGPQIEEALRSILACAGDGDAYTVHQRYEHLHPFIDGNGRSGRALWLWMMQAEGLIDHALAIGFLHNWYYQSLSASRVS